MGFPAQNNVTLQWECKPQPGMLQQLACHCPLPCLGKCVTSRSGKHNDLLSFRPPRGSVQISQTQKVCQQKQIKGRARKKTRDKNRSKTYKVTRTHRGNRSPGTRSVPIGTTGREPLVGSWQRWTCYRGPMDDAIVTPLFDLKNIALIDAMRTRTDRTVVAVALSFALLI